MPTYEYVCQECGFEFEIFQLINDPPLTQCPKCKGGVKKLIGKGAGVIFKGGGFFETDYKRKSTPHESSSDKKEKTEDNPKRETEKGT